MSARLFDELSRKLTFHRQGPIFIGNGRRIDTSRHEPDSSLLTWMRALKVYYRSGLSRNRTDDGQVETDLVKNVFIINQGFEQTVLIERSDEGAKFMADRGPQATNVKMCFTFSNGDKRLGRVINYTGSGGINNGPIDEYRGQLRMQVDREAQTRYVSNFVDTSRANRCEDKKRTNSRWPSKQRVTRNASLRGSWTTSTLAEPTKPTMRVEANSCNASIRERRLVSRTSKPS